MLEQLALAPLGRRTLAGRRAIICGMTTFSSAENSGSSWWNW